MISESVWHCNINQPCRFLLGSNYHCLSKLSHYHLVIEVPNLLLTSQQQNQWTERNYVNAVDKEFQNVRIL